jgi:hypothetical protein
MGFPHTYQWVVSIFRTKNEGGGVEVSGGLKALLYILSFFIPVVGLIVGIIWMNGEDIEKKAIGKTCLTIGIVSIVLSCICWFALSALSLTPVFMTGY